MRENDRPTTSRRQFLSTVTRVPLAAAVAPSALTASMAGAAEARWKMKLSCSTIAFSSLPIEKACQRIAALGFEGVDVWSAHAGCPHLDDVLNRLGPDGLKQVLAENKLKLYTFSVYSGGYAKYAELLGKCGGGVAVRGSTRRSDPKQLDANTKKFLESLKPLVELAEKYDSYLAIENHGGALLNTLDSFKAFVDNNKHPRLGIALAPYHVQGQKQSVEEAIKICGKQLFFFYAWQRSRGTGQLPGIGPTDCTPWIAALAEAGYKWYVNPFMHHEPKPDEMSPLLAKSADYLRQCYAKAVK